MSYDDLAFESLRPPPAAVAAVRSRVLCADCTELVLPDIATRGCPNCGRLLTNVQPVELKGAPTTAAATGNSDDATDGPNMGAAAGQSAMMHALLQEAMMGDGQQFVLPPSLLNEAGNGTGNGAGNHVAMNAAARNMMAMLQAQQGVDIDALMTQMLNDTSLSAPSASKKFRDGLIETQMTPRDFVQLVVAFDGITRPLIGTPAWFGHSLVAAHKTDNDKSQQHVALEAVACEPLEGNVANNGKSFAGRLVLMRRGKVSFVDKCRLAQKHGAAAVVVEQSTDQWPYVMGDEAKLGGDITIPCVMISKKDGEFLRQAVTKANAQMGAPPSIIPSTTTPTTEETKIVVEQSGAPKVRIFSQEHRVACPVCRDDYDLESKSVRLPCSHLFHSPCILPWIEKRNTCPLCRFALPTDAKPVAVGHQPDGNQVQLQIDMFT